MATGTITRWNKERAFGFVRPAAGGRDVFVHANDLSALLQQALREGKLEGLVVEFEVVEGQKGSAAKNVRPDAAAALRTAKPQGAPMRAFTFAYSGIKPGLAVVLTTVGGKLMPVVQLGDGEHTPMLSVPVRNAPRKPCSYRGEGAYGHTKFGASWASNAAPAAKPEKPHVCTECGQPYLDWQVEDWDNGYEGERRTPGTFGQKWVANHPDKGHVPTRMMVAQPGASGSGDAVLFGAEATADPAVLIRVNTNTGYTRDARGGWDTLRGNPETLVRHGSATSGSARLGTFADGLVILHPGDVLKVSFSGGYKTDPVALFLGEDSEPTFAPYEEWAAGQKAVAAVKGTVSNSASLRFKSMPAYSFGHLGQGQGWGVTRGIPTTPMTGGRGFKLGPRDGNWRIENWVTVMAVGLPELVTNAAVAGDKTPVLVASSEVETGKFLVRIDTAGLRKGGRTGATVYAGSPTLLTQGDMEIGTANIQAHYDQLWVVGENDVLRIGQSWTEDVSSSDFMLFVRNGEVRVERIYPWMLAAGKADPSFFIREKYFAPLSHVPAEWIGRVVSIHRFVDDVVDRKVVGLTREPVWFDGGQFGELVSTKPLVVNTGWDGKDRHPEEVWVGREPVWVQLHPDKQVRRLEGDAAQQRSQGRTRANELLTELEATQALSYFRFTRMSFEHLLRDARYFDTGETHAIEYWVEKAESALVEFEAKRATAIDLERRVNASEILFDFSAWHRRGGVTNQGDGWVIRPDGTQRPADSNNVPRHKTDGTFVWMLVEAEELALLWQGGFTGEVAKLPVGGCTQQQLDAVATIELELGLNPNAFGLNAEAEDEQAKLMAAIVTACGNSGMIAFAHRLEISYHGVTSENGQMLESGFVRGDAKSLRQKLDQAGTTLTEIQGRFGRLAKTMNVAGGSLQFIVFNKYGRENLGIRWLPAFEAMVFGALAQSDILIRVPYISEEVLRSEKGFLTDESSFLYEVALADLVAPAKGFKSVVTDYNGAKVPAQVLEAFRGDTGTLLVLAYGEPGRKMKLCIRWRDNKPA